MTGAKSTVEPDVVFKCILQAEKDKGRMMSSKKNLPVFIRDSRINYRFASSIKIINKLILWKLNRNSKNDPLSPVQASVQK